MALAKRIIPCLDVIAGRVDLAQAIRAVKDSA